MKWSIYTKRHLLPVGGGGGGGKGGEGRIKLTRRENRNERLENKND